MWDRSDNKKGRVLILGGWSEKDKKFTSVQTYLDKLHNPNQIAFYTVGNKHYLYVAETGRLSYYTFANGDTIPSSSSKVVATFPDYGLSYKYGGWHLTRSLAFRNNKLYVSVGSSCNACMEKEEIRATVIEMNPDGSNQHIYARGLRNSVSMQWIGNELWATSMGRDGIGPDKPEDLLHTIRQNEFYGWPFYYQYKKAVYADAQFKDSAKPVFVKKPPVAPWEFSAHSAPLGFAYLTQFSDAMFNNSFLVALHGSTSVWRQRGNAVVQLMPNGKYREIVTGFLQGKTENKRYGRPCDVMVDTGMNRLGIAPRDVGSLSGLAIDTLMSHLASADEDVALNRRQRDAFAALAGTTNARRKSLANSAGIALGADFAFNLTRPGISLYGGRQRAEHAGIAQVVTPEVQIVQRRAVPAGDTVGYNATFVAPRDMDVAILNIGYADGYLRCFSGKGVARVDGVALPVIGRVSMDLVAIDVDAMAGLGEGDWVSLDYDLPETAALSGLSQYELITGLGPRFERVWG